MSYEDVASDLFDAIRAVPSAPDMDVDTPLELQAFGAALGLAAARLAQANDLWQTNTLIALPEWQNHHDETKKKRNRK